MVSPLHVKEYHVFLSSPRDMAKEREEVRTFFAQWNDRNPFSVNLKVIGDDTHSTIGVGHPQDLIIKQTLERFRSSLILFVGLLGQRFGTPTRNAESGTEEEFKWALEHWQEQQQSGEAFPEIKLFFKKHFEAPPDVSAIEAALEQYRKVEAFKQRCRNGDPPLYYKEFVEGRFAEVFRDDLNQWLSHPDRPWLKPVSHARPGSFARPASSPRQIQRVQVIAGKWFIEPNTDIKMLPIPEGRFRIGEGREGVTPWVRLSPFWISETPVTNRQYGIFLEMQHYNEPEFWRDPLYSDTQQPVVGVSWSDAIAFCSWLCTVTGLGFSLPSEAQWEYAARGTDGRQYPWGNDPPTPRRARYGRQYDRPASAGSYLFSRGPFWTLEQIGNVWEWCLDVWHPSAYEEWKDSEPLNPVTNEGEVEHADRRVLRGACWVDPPNLLPASTRYSQRASYTTVRAGFRVVTNLPDVK